MKIQHNLNYWACVVHTFFISNTYITQIVLQLENLFNFFLQTAKTALYSHCIQKYHSLRPVLKSKRNKNYIINIIIIFYLFYKPKSLRYFCWQAKKGAGWTNDVRTELKKCSPSAQYHRGKAPRQTQLRSCRDRHHGQTPEVQPWKRVHLNSHRLV